ncbi:MAG: hypothetical protein JO062_01615, partial [Bryobacterales bacterium]|nr:hypothetical protein [Bryobacterales bacterium]
THRLAGKGVHVRFRTQEFDVTVPREGDIHAVLKYLALVTPKQDKMPAAPDDPASFEIVFSENPERMISLGWGLGDDTGTRVVGPSDLEPSKR